MTNAHRKFYLDAGGIIPHGMTLDHLCRQKSCVNPEHLEPVTSAVNIKRKPSIKVTAKMVQEIRGLRYEGVRNRKIAEKFGLSETYTSAIARGKYPTPEQIYTDTSVVPVCALVRE